MKQSKVKKSIGIIIYVMVLGVLVALILSRGELAIDTEGVRALSIATKSDELLGLYVTYGIEKNNDSQHKIEKKGRIYGKIEYGELIFDEIDGAYYTAYAVDNKGNADYTQIMKNDKISLGDTFITYEELNNQQDKMLVLDVRGTMYIDKSCPKSVTCYINPIYKDVLGRVYVTDVKSQKIEIPASGKLDDSTSMDELSNRSIIVESDEMNITKIKDKKIKLRIFIRHGEETQRMIIKALDKNLEPMDTVVYNKHDIMLGSLKIIPLAERYSQQNNNDAEHIFESDVLKSWKVNIKHDGIILKEKEIIFHNDIS